MQKENQTKVVNLHHTDIKWGFELLAQTTLCIVFIPIFGIAVSYFMVGEAIDELRSKRHARRWLKELHD